LNTRVRGAEGNRYAHTLNGTACAIARTLVFLFEHYQDENGAFAIPDVLQQYTGFARVEPRGE
jgi:seryl-tRNA synthetase